MMQPPETIESIAMPRRPSSSRTSLAGCAPKCAGSGSAAAFRAFWNQRNESARLATINHGHHHYARPAFPSAEQGFDTGSIRSHWEQVPQDRSNPCR